MIRFAEAGWANLDNKSQVNVDRTEILPATVQASASSGKQKRRARPETVTAAFSRRHTRIMTTDAARKAVFNTPELLENIISFLPSRDILTKVQRLSRQWKTAVESSPTIKNKLWMTSCKTPAVQSIGFTDEHIPEDPMWRQHARPMYYCDIILNSTLFSKVLHCKGAHALQLGSKNQYLSFQEPDNNGGAWAFSTILFYSNVPSQQNELTLSPTWKSMYLTDPPITTGMLSLHPRSLALHGPDDVYLHLTDETGITLGLVYDTIFETVEAQYGATVTSGDLKHFLAGFHFVSVSASLGTDILVCE